MRSVDQRILALAIPALGTLAAEPLYRLVDTAIVGRLGTDQLAGLAVAVTLLALVVAGSNFLAYGTTQRVANRLGAGQPSEAADVGVQALWIAGFVSVVAVPVLVLGARTLASAIGADGDVLDFAVEYLQIAAVGVPFVLIALAAQGMQRGASDYRTPLVILVCSNIANLLIELVLVFGFDLGIAGAAWSTTIAQAGAGVAFLVVVRRHLAPARHRWPDGAEMAPLLTAGSHLLLRVGSMLAVFTGATAIAARVDDATLAAHQIAMTMFLFLALVLDALAIPAQTLVAEELGHDGSGAAEVARRVVRLSVIAAAVIALLMAATSTLLPHAFSDDPAVVSRATSALLFLAVLLLPGAIAFADDGVLIGLGDYRFLGRAAFCYLLAVAPIAAVVLATPSLGIAGIWGGLVVWMTLRAVVNTRRVRTVLPAPVDRSGR
ncbi:MAG TPA: MATE family efflux transporter [Ilumatobacteraceae bacterium]|nr:MATE family efflux transporter [Ilumatobacteraceae bacterium]